jgi:type IV pilus assembly protein PilW
MNPMRRIYKARRAGLESGYSLIELMVAMAISAFLLAGLFTIFQGTRHTSDQQTGLSELQDEERLAMTMISDIVQIAGAFTDATNNTAQSVLLTDGGNFTNPGQALFGATPAATGPDTLTVRFQTASGDGVLNCNGVANASGAPVVYSNTYSIATNAAGVSQLLCLVQTGIPAAGAAVAVPLVNNVTNMQFWYAVNTTGSTPLTPITSTGTSAGTVTNAGCPADTYIATASMGANDWSNVCAVKVVLTFVNPLYQPAGQPKPTPGQVQTVQFARVIGIQAKAGPNMTSVQAPAGAGGAGGGG